MEVGVAGGWRQWTELRLELRAASGWVGGSGKPLGHLVGGGEASQ